MKTSMQQRDLSNIKGHVMNVENINVIAAIMATMKENLNTHSQYEHKNKSKNQNLYVNKEPCTNIALKK